MGQQSAISMPNKTAEHAEIAEKNRKEFESSLRLRRPRRLVSSDAFTLSLLGVGILITSVIWPAWHYEGDRPAFVSLYAVQFALYGLACWLVWRSQKPTKHSLKLILIFALAFRMTLLATDPHLSDDIYRYVWDGKIQAAGINPYRYIPADEKLIHLRDSEIFPYINRKDYARTIYPPAAQMIFLGVHALFGTSIRGMKLALIGFDLLTIAILILTLRQLAMDPNRVILYAWHPLALWEIAHSGHIDAAALTFIVMALLFRLRERLPLAGAFLGLATLVKLYPVLLLPAFYKKWDWKLPAALFTTVALGYLPYLSVGWGVLGYLPGYFREERFVSGQRLFPLEITRLLVPTPTWIYVAIAAVILGLVTWKVLNRTPSVNQYADGSLLLVGTALLLATPHYAWYFLWLLPFLCLRFSAAWFYLLSAAVLLYFVRDRSKSEIVFACLQYIPVYGLLIWNQMTRYNIR